MDQRKRVLISNDDGIMADGLIAITRALHRAGYDLRVAAPSKQQSGVSHCVTLWAPVTCEEYKLPDELAVIPAYMIDGTPADCVKLALTSLLKDWRPHLVVSGINLGLNCGRSVIYSGTVGAAMEACINGVPSVAMSLDFGSDPLALHAVNAHKLRWDTAAHFGLLVVQTALVVGIPEGSFIGVNVPDLPIAQVKGLKLTKQGTSTYDEHFKELPPQGGKRVFKLRGTYAVKDKTTEYDGLAVQDGYVSVTPMGMYFHTEDYDSIRAHFHGWKLFQQAEAAPAKEQ